MKRSILLGFLLAKSILLSAALPLPVKTNIDWPKFMAGQDMRWNKMPGRWLDCPFVGNGLLGATIQSNGKRLDIVIGRTDVCDHRQESGEARLDKCRLPIGSFHLTPVGKVQSGASDLSFWNAEAGGSITTERGQITWRCFVAAETNVLVFQTDATGDEQQATWSFEPAVSRSTSTRGTPSTYRANPPASETLRSENTDRVEQVMTAGGGYTTFWREQTASAGRRTIYTSIAYAQSDEALAKASDETVQLLDRTEAGGVDALRTVHQKWWHCWYPAAFLSVPDKQWERFYWAQMYKLASATRADKPLMDLCGPWFLTTEWPAVWWNLNVELAYAPTLTGNRLDITESLIRNIDRAKSNLEQNTPAGAPAGSIALGRITSYDMIGKVSKEYGNLTWVLEVYWRYYRSTMDDAMLRDRLLPLMKKNFAFYRWLLKPAADGTLHLENSSSPEYASGPDVNYDLALIRWLGSTLLQANERLKLNDPEAAMWKDTLARLTPLPTDPGEGLLIGRDLHLKGSHRHWSHLLGVYPLAIFNFDDPEDRELITRSLNHWTSMLELWRGYSWCGAASMYALMGDSEKAHEYLENFMKRGNTGFNTLYKESGPCIETPLQAAASLQDMLLQSHGDTIRVFPAVPDSWKDVCFQSMRAQGAFLVSAVRAAGATQFVQVTSLAGEPCKVKVAIEGATLNGEPIQPNSSGTYNLRIAKGESAILAAKGVANLRIAPVPGR